MKNTSKSTRITEAKMSKNPAAIRFEKARRHLAQTLRNIEEVVKDKIHETAMNSKMLDVSGESDGSSNNKLIEQNAIIQNLNEEINDLQKNLSELGEEGDTLSDENKDLAIKLQKLQKDSRQIIELIESDLIKIEEVVNDN
jgi:predicted  nucleic acid-binding Zn-ribbon protein